MLVAAALLLIVIGAASSLLYLKTLRPTKPHLIPQSLEGVICKPNGFEALMKCTSSGTPTPTITWLDHRGKAVGYHGVLYVRSSEGKRYTCVAENVFGRRVRGKEALSRWLILANMDLHQPSPKSSIDFDGSLPFDKQPKATACPLKRRGCILAAVALIIAGAASCLLYRRVLHPSKPRLTPHLVEAAVCESNGAMILHDLHLEWDPIPDHQVARL